MQFTVPVNTEQKRQTHLMALKSRLTCVNWSQKRREIVQCTSLSLLLSPNSPKSFSSSISQFMCKSLISLSTISFPVFLDPFLCPGPSTPKITHFCTQSLSSVLKMFIPLQSISFTEQEFQREITEIHTMKTSKFITEIITNQNSSRTQNNEPKQKHNIDKY